MVGKRGGSGPLVGKPKAKRKAASSDEEISSESEPSDVSERSVHLSEDEFEDETPNERHIRLTKKALAAALKAAGSDEEDATATLSLRLQEEALQARGKLLFRVADKFAPVSSDSIICLRAHKKSINCICISSDCEYIYSGGKDAALWSLKDFRKVKFVSGSRRGSLSRFHSGPILSIAISDDSKYLVILVFFLLEFCKILLVLCFFDQASGSADKRIIIWAPDNLEIMFCLQRHFSPVTALSFRRQSHMMFSGDRSGRVCVWNMPLTEALQDQGAATKIEVLSLCGLSAERCLSSSGVGGAGICLWKVEEEVCAQYSVRDPSELSVECVYAVNDDLFVGGSTSKQSTNQKEIHFVSSTLYLWHISRGSPISKIRPAHPLTTKDINLVTSRPAVNWVTAVSGLYGTDLIASGSSSGHVQLWRLVIEGKAFSFGGGGNEIGNGNGEPKSRGRFRVHHDKAEIVKVPEGEFHLAGYVNGLAFSNDGKWLAVGIGQEHRLGRWEERRKVNDTVCLLPIRIPFR
ncbi:unnamed protein product [Hydatigera taeniaeformis]|uniref:WD_REPEATS_REGION domain-containing protein n=1 Tax=Hydatigena taeniaeformis TaxID=6205 RepID=A0A0R3WJW8_HYDTA|nr:unnamed protein product [Hydatigera taeniaeformis]